jgi:hypothetical protein
MDLMRGLAWLYCLMFFGVVALDFVPSFMDAEGRLFGLFTLDFYDNSLHAASGIWAGLAAWHSRSWSVFYFRLFGLLYFFDGVLGLFTGSGYLDFGIFIYGALDLSLMIRFLANLPHLLIGGFAIYAGFVLSKREVGPGSPA